MYSTHGRCFLSNTSTRFAGEKNQPSIFFALISAILLPFGKIFGTRVIFLKQITSVSPESPLHGSACTPQPGKQASG